jgi:glucose/arabinose dehydrogenase
MAFSPDGILFVTVPSTAGLYDRNKSGGTVYALPDLDRDGKADEAKKVITGLSNRPHGLAFYEGYLYLAEENAVSRYRYLGNGDVAVRELVIGNLPFGADHVSRTIGFSPTGKMYVSVGSSCNVCQESDSHRAAIVEYSADGTSSRVFAEGLRNAVGFVFHPDTAEIWATENGRDLLGDDLPPDEINIVKNGRHYGWPFCYGKQIPDPQFSDLERCSTTEESLHDMQAHSAPLGLRFIASAQFPAEWQGDLLVAFHGSWNRTVPTGYKVVRLDVEGDRIVG